MISRHSVNNAVCITTLFYNNIALLLTYITAYHHNILYCYQNIFQSCKYFAYENHNNQMYMYMYDCDCDCTILPIIFS